MADEKKKEAKVEYRGQRTQVAKLLPESKPVQEAQEEFEEIKNALKGPDPAWVLPPVNPKKIPQPEKTSPSAST